jgi:Fe-S oxidoreductase
MCCGRPLYDYGLVETARKQLLQILETLREEIRAGIPLVVLEPSCAAVFRDELLNLFPRSEDARRLSRQTFVLSEFLERERPEFHLPQRTGRALVQIHCHHSAIMKKTDEKKVLEKLGLDCEFPDSGCCGMAGSFGFEHGEKYDVSVKAGERSLFPRIRETADDTLIIADGFSCREQIHQGTNRNAVHLAEVIHPVRFESNLPSFVPLVRTAALIGTIGAFLFVLTSRGLREKFGVRP